MQGMEFHLSKVPTVSNNLLLCYVAVLPELSDIHTFETNKNETSFSSDTTGVHPAEHI